ncbi:MAG: sce7726 family protein [Nitrospira sp.]|nr:sce7726 family protein [Nitrospira sp.]
MSFPESDTKSIELGDSEIRSVLRSQLSKKYAHTSHTVLIEELGLRRGQVRVDLSVVNGLLHGYEIKSDRDSLRRLNGQVELYGKVFDRATLVVGQRHLAEAIDNVPHWWGILLVCQSAKGLRLKTVRHPRDNPKKDPRTLVELLWLDDALAMLEERNAARGFRGKARWMVWNRICELCSLDEIAKAVRTNLKARPKRQLPA